jgi:DNA-directed RNA polymerase specialized sigma24 family protein
VVLERLMPAFTARAAARARHAPDGFGAALEELTATAWIAICTYPLDRRPAKIAANLVADTVSRLHGPRRLVDRVTRPCDRPPEPACGLDGRPAAAASPAAELLDVLAGGMPAAQLRLLNELAVLGCGQAELAALVGVSDRTVRTRRNAAVDALRAAVLPAAAATGAGAVA